MNRNKKGQSTLEYIIVIAVIVAALIAFATTQFGQKYTSALNGLTDQMANVVNRISY